MAEEQLHKLKKQRGSKEKEVEPQSPGLATCFSVPRVFAIGVGLIDGFHATLRRATLPRRAARPCIAALT